MATNLPNRETALARAAALDSIDVLIIGAGINGAGTFRDLSLQGVRALIVDREDFGAGASMASSRMAHGGLRYLENGEFRLTAESTRERNLLLRNAPHLVRPLPLAIPFFSHTAGLLTALKRMVGLKASMRERGFVMAEIGLFLYDWFGRFNRMMPLHKMMLGQRFRAQFPSLHKRIVAGSIYYDALITMPERIALELVDDGLRASPASGALNHCEVVGLQGDTVLLRDCLGHRTFGVKPKLVLNAAGAWIDRVNGTLAPSRPLVGGTKGSHLILTCPELTAALAGHGMIFDDGEGRVCVVYPIRDRVLLGSTDIPVTDPDQAFCSDEEQAYLLRSIGKIFPELRVKPRHVVYRFCGVRPLPVSNAASPGAVSRDHSLVTFEATAERSFPILSLVGGKWTTFRAFAEQVSRASLQRLGHKPTTSTADLPIGGAAGLPETPAGREAWVSALAQSFELSPARAQALFGRYGSGASDVASFLVEGADRLLPGCPDLSEREIRRLVRHEMAATVDDVIFRRTTLAMEGRLSTALLERIATILAEETDVPPAVRDARLAEVIRRLSAANAVPALGSQPTPRGRGSDETASAPLDERVHI